MTLDEAIIHAEEVAEENYKLATAYHDDRNVYMEEEAKCVKCADEHMQLAEWLKDYKRLKEQEPTDEALHREREQAYMKGYEDASRRFRQEPQTGHWKRISMDKYSEHAKYWYICDRCGKDHLGNTDWCPNCGCRMVEQQERSE